MGDVDILVNNAGATWGAPAESHPIEAWDKVMNLNVRGYFILSQHIAKRSMIPRRQGRIINIASIAGLNGNPPIMTTIAYNTSKGAVINFTRTLARNGGGTTSTSTPSALVFPQQDDRGILQMAGEEAWPPMRRCCRLGDDEDLKGALPLYASDAGQAHHRSVAGGGRRRARLSPVRKPCPAGSTPLDSGFRVEIPLSKHLGFELTRFDGGFSQILTPRPST